MAGLWTVFEVYEHPQPQVLGRCWQGRAESAEAALRHAELAREARARSHPPHLRQEHRGQLVAEPFREDVFWKPALPEAIRTVGDLVAAAKSFDELRSWRAREHQHLCRPGGEVWLRGQADADWPLQPSALRPHALGLPAMARSADGGASRNLSRERDINRRFVQRGCAHHAGLADETQAYFIARHYKLPSRLLDWTRSPLAALFFACSSFRQMPDKDGAVVFLDVTWPCDWPDPSCWPIPEDREAAFASATREPLYQTHEHVREVIHALFNESESARLNCVLPVTPHMIDKRMVAQEARFTLHGPGAGPLESPYVHSVRIPAGSKARIMTELSRFGVRWESLFPDLEHLARDLSEGSIWMVSDQGRAIPTQVLISGDEPDSIRVIEPELVGGTGRGNGGAVHESLSNPRNLIRLLRTGSLAMRRLATDGLVEMGMTAVPELELASVDSDREVAQCARIALAAIAGGEA